MKGTLRVTLVSNLVATALDDAIAGFHASYPAVEIIVEVAAWTEVVNALMQHRIDVGICPTRVRRAELAYLHLFTEVHRPYCGRTHPLFGSTVAEPSELAPEPFVLTGADEGDELTQFRLEHGLGRNIAGISAHLEEAKRLAILGIGLCFLPEGYAQPDVDGGRLWGSSRAAEARRNAVPRLALYRRRAARPLGGRSTATTTSGSRTSLCRTARSPSSAACGPRTARPASRLATRSPPGGYVGGGLHNTRSPGGQRLGDEQLAGHRQLLRHPEGGALDPLRRPGRDDLLRIGGAGESTTDRAGPATLGE